MQQHFQQRKQEKEEFPGSYKHVPMCGGNLFIMLATRSTSYSFVSKSYGMTNNLNSSSIIRTFRTKNKEQESGR